MNIKKALSTAERCTRSGRQVHHLVSWTNSVSAAQKYPISSLPGVQSASRGTNKTHVLIVQPSGFVSFIFGFTGSIKAW